ncbi:type II secretion system F family protein [Vreelandella populi]|uniref:Type II secretion system F family protein n=1 Tax=Vreelandella populi TaxID=2498858 RepID=A0A3S0YLT5_9GAMM|nr:type II secretion system F family protein [Halomonas populi]RUR36636.1 type II secretion system F family protein [Halomonas populi]RUR45097.1 type II secretion system F family protein [Halomonas populi]
MARQTNKLKARPRHLYRWKWIGIGPQARPLTGESIGHSKTDIIVELSKQNIHVRRIQRKGGSYSSGSIKSADIMIFSRQMATMINAGIPLLQALYVVAESLKKPSMVALLKQLADDVASGTSFSDALGHHPQHFDRLFIHLVQAGEQAGTLSSMLERNAVYKEKVESLKARVKKALWYPFTVLITGWGITLLLLIKVVPQFESMFQSFGAELPALTQLIVNLSVLAQQLWLPLLGILMTTVLVFKWLVRRSSALAYRLDKAILQLPVIGSIVNKAAVARFARTLATTFASGVPLVDGLDTAAGSSGNKVYEQAVRQVRQDVATGQQLHFSMRMTNCFPTLTVQMVSIGEEAGALATMLHRVAEYYEEEVDNAVDALTSLMEPLIIIILGILVGGIVVSMYLPIFDLGTVI